MKQNTNTEAAETDQTTDSPAVVQQRFVGWTDKNGERQKYICFSIDTPLIMLYSIIINKGN